MIDQTFVEAIERLTGPKVLTLNGKEYASYAVVNPPPPNEPAFPGVKLASLDSLIDYLKADPVVGAFCLAGAQSVDVLSEPKGENRKRDCFVSAIANAGNGFSVGNYQSLEDFRIALLTQFTETVFRTQVLNFIATITDSNIKTSEDNGVSQSVTVKASIATRAEATVPSPVRLNPIRTFIEVEQPEGLFLFRLKSVKDALPQASLFELHTNWQRTAALSVKAYLDSHECPLPVFA